MRGFVEAQEQLARNMPEGREPTAEETLAYMADQLATRIDMARDRADEFIDLPEDDELPEDMG